MKRLTTCTARALVKSRIQNNIRRGRCVHDKIQYWEDRADMWVSSKNEEIMNFHARKYRVSPEAWRLSPEGCDYDEAAKVTNMVVSNAFRSRDLHYGIEVMVGEDEWEPLTTVEGLDITTNRYRVTEEGR